MTGRHPSVYGSTAIFKLSIRQFRLQGNFADTVKDFSYAVTRKPRSRSLNSPVLN